MALVSWSELAQADSNTPLSMSSQMEIFSLQLDIHQVCTWGETAGLKIERFESYEQLRGKITLMDEVTSE